MRALEKSPPANYCRRVLVQPQSLRARRPPYGLAVGVLLWVLSAGVGCATPMPVVQAKSTLTDSDLVAAYASQDNQDSPDFSEQLVLRAVLKGGGKVYVRLLITNLAGAEGRVDGKVRVHLPDGRKFNGRVKKKRDGWTYGDGRFDVTVGETLRLIASVGSATLSFRDDAFSVDLKVASTLPALRPAGGIVDQGGAFYVTTIPIPRGQLTGSLTPLAGVAEGAPAAPVALEGVANTDHRAGNIAPYAMALRTFSFREETAERTTVVGGFKRGKALGSRRQGWLYVADDKGLVAYQPALDVRPQAWDVDTETGYRVPGVFYVEDARKAAAPRRFRGVIRANALTEKKDDLKNLKRLERFVVRRLMKPWTFRYNDAQFVFKQRRGAKEKAIRGLGTYQVQQLNAED